MTGHDETDLQLDDWETLGKRIKESREYLGLSQAQVAEVLDIARPSVSLIESGKRRVSVLELKTLAKLFRRSYSYFVGELDETTLEQDESLGAIFRASMDLSDVDRDQVRRFAEFLKQAGEAPGRADAE